MLKQIFWVWNKPWSHLQYVLEGIKNECPNFGVGVTKLLLKCTIIDILRKNYDVIIIHTYFQWKSVTGAPDDLLFTAFCRLQNSYEGPCRDVRLFVQHSPGTLGSSPHGPESVMLLRYYSIEGSCSGLYLWLGMLSANRRMRYTCSDAYHWPGSSSATERNRSGSLSALKATCCLIDANTFHKSRLTKGAKQ